ncbi:MAG: VCBS repeat-containing protein [Chitinivibrionales bacterium]|nr:VCBS repeat-containing protein [Chitinivibrionales bacterium]MBD3395420.1 VCBS repeat-containing protein [Chitinivibrionales bacterium]
MISDTPALAGGTMQFEHQVIDPSTPGIQNDICLIADVNGDGYNDIIICGKRYEKNCVWYEYPSWKRHLIGTASTEAGGAAIDITGNGLPDIVAGHPGDAHPAAPGRELFWMENPGTDGGPWPKHLIHDIYEGQHHDQAVGDIDNDGKPEIIFAAQEAGIIGYYDIPADPRQTPWPGECRHIICDDLKAVEGLVVADLDSDGEMELLAGPYWFKRRGDSWEKHVIDPTLVKTTAAVGDINGDGKPEVILAEGESYPARLVWFGNAPAFDEAHLLADDLFHPHSLAVGDMDGDGLLDIFVGEMSLGKHPSKPRLMVYRNTGGGNFEQVIIDEGRHTHCAKIGDIGNTGRLSIVGKPFEPGNHVEMWLNRG